MQTVVALSSTEAELISASDALWATINLVDIAKEAYDRGVNFNMMTPGFKTTLFEDNTGTIELIRVRKLQPKTKHINNKFYHFRQHVEQGDINVVKVASEDQPADMLTKPLGTQAHQPLCCTLMGWL